MVISMMYHSVRRRIHMNTVEQTYQTTFFVILTSVSMKKRLNCGNAEQVSWQKRQKSNVRKR